jgi:hypothetical protein
VCRAVPSVARPHHSHTYAIDAWTLPVDLAHRGFDVLGRCHRKLTPKTRPHRFTGDRTQSSLHPDGARQLRRKGTHEGDPHLAPLAL